MERLRIQVFGNVQGVFYRHSTRQKALSLGLTGWVSNNSKGVEIVAEGEKEKLEKLAAWAKQGPPLARVEKTKVSWEPATQEFSDFEIKY